MDGVTDQAVADEFERVMTEIAAIVETPELTDDQRDRRDELIGLMRQTNFSHGEIAQLFKMKFGEVYAASLRAKRKFSDA